MCKRCFAVLLFFFMLVSIGGAYATWLYAESSPFPQQQTVGVSMTVFDFPPEEVLPGGNTGSVTLGENHLALTDLILNESNKGYGLNYSPSVLLHNYLKKQKVVYSNQKVTGGNLKFILDAKNNTHGLYYCLEKVSDTEYYCYTFSVNDLSSAKGTNDEIIAYRTTLIKTDKWRATVSYFGYAQTKSLAFFGVSADSNTIAYSIDVQTWYIKTN